MFEVGLGCPWVRGLGLIRGGETQWQVDKKGVRNLGGSKKIRLGWRREDGQVVWPAKSPVREVSGSGRGVTGVEREGITDHRGRKRTVQSVPPPPRMPEHARTPRQ